MTEPRGARRRPVRMLHILACDELAGTELMLANLAERLDPTRFRTEVATLAVPGPVARRLSAAGIAVYSLGGRGQGLAAARLARLLRQGRFDVVVAYGFRVTMIARVLVRLLAGRTAFVSGVRGLHVTEVEDVASVKSRLVLALERLTSRLVSVYDANSPGAVELMAASGIDRRRLRYIPNGIDAERWLTGYRDRGEQEVPVVLCVARFSRIKRHGDLLCALAHLQEEGAAFRAILVGDGPMMEASKELSRDLDIDGAVEFRGRVVNEDISELMGRADIFCLPSLWEGMPGSIMEAMASGLPVVATDVNGINELVVDSETGVLVPPQRPELLAAALRSLLADPSRARALGEAGRRRIERNFSMERMVRAKEELYAAIAEAR